MDDTRICMEVCMEGKGRAAAAWSVWGEVVDKMLGGKPNVLCSKGTTTDARLRGMEDIGQANGTLAPKPLGALSPLSVVWRGSPLETHALRETALDASPAFRLVSPNRFGYQLFLVTPVPRRNYEPRDESASKDIDRFTLE